MADPAWERVTTIDAVHGALVREALDGADIRARLIPVRPDAAYALPPLVIRAQLHVEVPAERAAAARSLLAELAESGARAAEAEAERTLVPDDEVARAPLWRRALRWMLGRPPATPAPPGDEDGRNPPHA